MLPLFSTVGSLCVLYTILARPKLEHASVSWNSITSTELTKLEKVQRKFTAERYSINLWAYIAKIINAFYLATLNLNTLFPQAASAVDVIFLNNAITEQNELFFPILFCIG